MFRRLNIAQEDDHLVLLKLRLKSELDLSEKVVRVATKIGEKVLQMQGKEGFESLFEFLACYVLAIKLIYGLNDE